MSHICRHPLQIILGHPGSDLGLDSRQDEQLKTLFAWAKEPKLLSKCRGSEVVGIQVSWAAGMVMVIAIA